MRPPSPRFDPPLSAYERLATPVWVVDPQCLRLLWGNRAARVLWRVPELAGRALTDATGPVVRRCLRAAAGADGARTLVSWPLPGDDGPGEVPCACSRIEADGRPAVLVEAAVEWAEWAEPESTYRALAEQSLVGIGVLQDGRVQYANPHLAQMLGYTVEALTRVELATLVHPQDRALVAENLRRRLSGEVGRLRYRLRALHRDGRVLHLEVHGSRIAYRGRPAVASVAVDVTEQVRAQEQLRQAREFSDAVLDTSGALVVVLDRAGRIVRFNRACERLSGFRERDVLGRNGVELLVPELEREQVDAVFRRLIGGEFPSAFENHWSARDGARRLIAWSNTALLSDAGAVEFVVATGIDVTEQRQAEAAVRASERVLREITDVVADGIYVLDRQGRVTFVNPAAERMLGWAEADLLGRDAHAAFHDDGSDRSPRHACPALAAIRAGRPFRGPQERFVRRDGSALAVAMVSAPILREGAIAGSVTSFHDIAEQMVAQRRLEESEERYRVLFNSSHDAVFVHPIGPDGTPGTFVEVNDVACERLGYAREELLRMAPADIDQPIEDDGAAVARLQRDGFAVFERYHRHRDGHTIPVEISARLFRLRGTTLAISLARDVSDRKAAQARIHQLAYYDPLTGLPNRTSLLERLAPLLPQARRHRRRVALMFLDLDGFKDVNDTLGHDAGDDLLRAMAQRMTACVREGDIVSRMGGDEFIIVLAEVRRREDAARVARKLIAAVAEPLVVHRQTVRVTASVGIALFPADGDSALALMKHADRAMYRAKASGKNGFCW